MAAIAARMRSERGAELVELMIVFPLFMLLTAAIVDFGMLMRNYEVVTNAAREGARVAVLDSNYSDQDITDRIDSYFDAAGMGGTYTVAVANVPVTTGAGTFTGRAVTVNYNYQWAVLGGLAAFFGGSFTTLPVQATSVMRSETAAAPAP